MKEIAEADRLADAALQRSSVDSNALFVKSVTLGSRRLLLGDSVCALPRRHSWTIFSPPLLPRMLTKPRTVCFCQGHGVRVMALRRHSF